MIISTVEFQICFRGVCVSGGGGGGVALFGLFCSNRDFWILGLGLSNVPSSVFTRNTAGRKYNSASYSIMANLLVISHLWLTSYLRDSRAINYYKMLKL